MSEAVRPEQPDDEPEGEFVSKQMGFMIQAVQESKQQEHITAFSRCKTDEERFMYVWRLPATSQVIQLEPEYNKKSSTEAATFRAAGNKYFQKKSYLSALESYNKAVVQAPIYQLETEDENQLALAYANRSATLLHLHKYHEALLDAELAADNDYPKLSMYKLFDRQGKCYRALGNKTKAVESFQKAQENVAQSDLHPTVMDKWKDNLAKQITEVQSLPDTAVAKKTGPEVPKVTKLPQEKYPCLSTSVEVNMTKTKGRHLLAAEDIQVGEVLASETPYASILFADHHQDHCYHCIKKTEVPIPCKQCASVIYCSVECREAAWRVYHRYECLYYVLFDKFLCAKIGHLAIRMVMVAGLNFLLEFLRNEKNKGTAEKSAEPKGGVYDHSYYNIYHLNAHAKDRFPVGLFDFAVMACFLNKILQESEFYIQDEQDLATEDNLQLIGGALLRHLQIIQCNGNRIQQLKPSCRFDEPKSDLLSVAIYPSAALVNHSCDPVADFNYYGNKIILRAVRQIHKGEEVAISYGPVFYDAKRNIRQLQLNRCYYFACDCEPCKEYWPTVGQLADCPIMFRCELCRAPMDLSKTPHKKIVQCGACQHKQNMEEVMGRLELSHETFTSGMSDAFSERYEEALGKFVDHLILLQQYLCQPWRDFTSCQVSIKHCYRLLENK